MRRRGKKLLVLSMAVAMLARADGNDLNFEFAGCAEFRDDRVCELGADRRLTLWLDAVTGAGIEFSAGGQRVIPDEEQRAEGGTRFDISLPPDALRLDVSRGQGADQTSAALLFAMRVRADAAARADELLDSHDYDRSLTLIDGALADATPAARGELLRTRGRIFLRRGQRDAAQDALTESIRTSRSAGYRQSAVMTANALAFSMMHGSRDFGAARRLIESLPQEAGHAEANYFRHHDLGLIAFNSGDARNALRHLDAAAAQARRVGWQRRALNSESILALQLQQLGRREQARRSLEQWRGRLPDDLPGCEKALFYTNLGWSALLALDAGEQVEDPRGDLLAALELTDQNCNENERANARINLALALYHSGALDSADDMLLAARRQTDQPELGLVLWSDDIAARIALDSGRLDESHMLYSRLEALASVTLSPSASWRAAIGRARVLAAMGENELALDSFANAEAQLDADLLRIPVDSGRETLLASRDRAEQQHLALLLDAGRVDTAFELARRSHSRSLQAVHLPQRLARLTPRQRARWDEAIARYRALDSDLDGGESLSWTLPADELARRRLRREQHEQQLRSILDDALAALDQRVDATPVLRVDPGELFVQVAQLPDGWAVFSHDGSTLSVRRPECANKETSEARATCLLAGLAESVREAELLRIAANGALARIDFHALLIDGVALAQKLPVVYAAGLSRGPAGTMTQQGHALLISDPRNDLRGARSEVSMVADLLRGTGRWSTEVLAGDGAQAAGVLARLANTDLFHYAGHARFDGEAGWRSALVLAGESYLDVADILALGHAPSLVVLSGCETAGAARGNDAQQFTLAHAFLAGGAGGVIATSRPVTDTSAQLLVGEFYRVWGNGAPAHIAFNQAQQALRTRHADPDWAAFRLMEP